MDIANNLRLLRKAYGRSRSCLAVASGLTVAKITVLECGLMLFSSALVDALARGLRVSPNMLLSDPAYIRRFVKWHRSRKAGQ
jgi:transcriptional regulator with XRE-family HTH domain